MLGFEEIPNLIGAGIGTTPRYSGAREKVTGIAPAVRYQRPGSARYLEWYGTLADVNLLESKRWQFGPAVALRLGRQDADDPAVARLPEIDHTLEAGALASFTYAQRRGIPFRLRLGVSVLGDLGGVYSGLNVSPFATFWVPLSERLFVGLGAGFTWSSESYNRAFFGVTPQGAAASGLPAFSPGSGVRQVYALPSVVFRIAPGWYGALGVYYARITGDAADSPIVAERGKRDQVTAGFGVGYTWK